eukprot:g55025.t1
MVARTKQAKRSFKRSTDSKDDIKHMAESKEKKRKTETEKEWKVFVDLQCQYSRRLYMEHLEKIKKAFEPEFNITVHLTSLNFHHQAFFAQKAAKVISINLGEASRKVWIDRCFKEQTKYMDDACCDMSKKRINALMADLAEEAGLLIKDGDAPEGKMKRADFLAQMDDFQKIVLPTWREIKEAIAYGVSSAPSHVVQGKKMESSESDWAIRDYQNKLVEMGVSAPLSTS